MHFLHVRVLCALFTLPPPMLRSIGRWPADFHRIISLHGHDVGPATDRYAARPLVTGYYGCIMADFDNSVLQNSKVRCSRIASDAGETVNTCSGWASNKTITTPLRINWIFWTLLRFNFEVFLSFLLFLTCILYSTWNNMFWEFEWYEAKKNKFL